MSFDSIKSKLRDVGVKPENVAKGVPIFLGISFAWIGILWSFCYAVSPSKTVLSRIPIKYIQDAFKKQHSIEQHPFLLKIPERIRGRVGLSFCEMLVIKSLVAPISLPLKIWLTIKLL
jgi:hypothetical protein